MAGKPERVPPGQPSPAPPTSQQQAPLQNVIVYVSENFPQTYMTQQNVECREAYSNEISGSGYINAVSPATSMNSSNQILKTGKTQEFLPNGFLSVQNNGAYFSNNCNNGEGEMAQNSTFNNSCQMTADMMNNYSYVNNGNTIINHGFDSMKCASESPDHQIGGVQEPNTVCTSNGTSQHLMMSNGESMGIYAVAQHQQNVPVSGMQSFTPSNQMDQKQMHDSGTLENFMTVMGDSNANNLSAPRCDSVRSDAAESSCSSLSSTDCQQDSVNNSVAVLSQSTHVQNQIEINQQQHGFQTGQNMSGFINRSGTSSSQIFSNNSQQVTVNSNMGQHAIQSGMSHHYIPPGEHQIQILQGNLHNSPNQSQYLQSGANRVLVSSNAGINCSSPQMAPANQNHPQLISSGSNQLQIFPQNVNQVHVVSNPVSSVHSEERSSLPQHLLSGTESQLVGRQKQPHLAASVASSIPPVTSSVHQSVQFVTSVAGNSKMVSLESKHDCAVGSQVNGESAVKMQSNCLNPHVNQVMSGPHEETVIAPSPALVPFGWKRLHNNGSVFYMSMDSLSFDESFSEPTGRPSFPLHASTPKASKIKGNLICPYCDKRYVVQHYFDQHVKSHKQGVNLTQNSINASQPIHLDVSNLNFSLINDSVSSKDKNNNFKVPAPVGKKKNGTVVKSKPKPKYICTYCAKGYLCQRSYKAHVRLHAIQDAASRFPDKEKILDNVQEITDSALNAVANAPCSGENGKKFKEFVGYVVSICAGNDWKEFSFSVCEQLLDSILDKKCLLPSALLACIMNRVEIILSDRKLCDDLMEMLNIPLCYDVFLHDLFFLEYILNVAKAVLRYITKTFCVRRQPVTKPPPELDADDKQVIYYIAGSIMRGYLRIAYRYKNSQSWKEIVKVLKSNVLIEKPKESEMKDAKWTLSVDRGGLLYISDKCQEFFVALTDVVFASEQKDGSIDYEQVIKKVSNSEVSLLWDDLISDSLSETNSLNLMNDVICCFCRTCCRGFTKRRLNFLKTKAVASMPTRHAVASRKKASPSLTKKKSVSTTKKK